MKSKLSLLCKEEDDNQPDVIDLTTSCAYWGAFQFPVRPPDTFADNESVILNKLPTIKNIPGQLEEDASGSTSALSGTEKNNRNEESVTSTVGVVLDRIQNKSHRRQSKYMMKLNHDDVSAILRRNSFTANASSDYDVIPNTRTKHRYVRSKTADILISHESSIKNVQLVSRRNTQSVQPSTQRRNGSRWVTLKHNFLPAKSKMNLTENVYETPMEQQSSSSSLDSIVENKQGKKNSKSSTFERPCSISIPNSSTSYLSSVDNPLKKSNSPLVNRQRNTLNDATLEIANDTSLATNTNRHRSPLNELRNIIRRIGFKNHKNNKDSEMIDFNEQKKTSIKNHLQKQQANETHVQIADVEQMSFPRIIVEPLKVIYTNPQNFISFSPVPLEHANIQLDFDKVIQPDKRMIQDHSRYSFDTNNARNLLRKESITYGSTTPDDMSQDYQRKGNSDTGGYRKRDAQLPYDHQQLRVHWHDENIHHTTMELEQIVSCSLNLSSNLFELSNKILNYLQNELQLKLTDFYCYPNSSMIFQNEQNLEIIKYSIELQCRQFVLQSNSLVNGTIESVDTCISTLIDLYRRINKYTSIVNDNEQSVQLLKCTIQLIDVFKSCIHSAKLLVHGRLYDENIRMLMRQTSTLAQVLNELLKYLNNYKNYSMVRFL
ncbi:unnamed protein product [Didymodactylos carnosus]|uniref:Uncharacterized protein n=1 Tax=Didymodactylos carnosus TaxID=1234261 RepID=A0A814QIP4_9BILA|nr:unnamed protein product [Didymodactylos carnosus]CAF1272184.1 unnamed protein product [Didymodactylos carnosus]CAF3884003.1 unnamed protein product [Didymodactylos carnosus]CAF4077557.1 unnamed protein product [Didymodactylos carnosus]